MNQTAPVWNWVASYEDLFNTRTTAQERVPKENRVFSGSSTCKPFHPERFFFGQEPKSVSQSIPVRVAEVNSVNPERSDGRRNTREGAPASRDGEALNLYEGSGLEAPRHSAEPFTNEKLTLFRRKSGHEVNGVRVMKYADYLKTDHWKWLRSRKRNRCCAICGVKGQPLDRHHLNYRHLFDVQKSDLRNLCRACHETAHHLLRTGILVYRSESNHSRFSLTKNAVKKYRFGRTTISRAEIAELQNPSPLKVAEPKKKKFKRRKPKPKKDDFYTRNRKLRRIWELVQNED